MQDRPRASVGGRFTTLGYTGEDRRPGITAPGYIRALSGCSCSHADWEHSGFRDGCLVRGCKCNGWWRELGQEVTTA